MMNISAKDGNAVLLSESGYQGFLETLQLLSDAEMKDKLLRGMDTPLSECVPENQVDW